MSRVIILINHLYFDVVCLHFYIYKKIKIVYICFVYAVYIFRP